MHITPSHLLEYLYCPRFTYYEYTLRIPQREEKRFKVQKGRNIHEEREKINPKYLRKKLGVIRKEQEVMLDSPALHIRGKVDEILWFDDGTMAPFDYKYAEYKERLWKSLKVQAAMYAMMIKDIYQKEVNVAYICYIRSKYKVIEYEFTKRDFKNAQTAIEECFDIIQSGYYPQATKIKERCKDCTYRNLCI